MKNQITARTLVLSLFVLLFAGISPNLLVAAQAGYFNMSELVVRVLFPSIGFLALTLLLARWKNENVLVQTVLAGALAGIIGTVGLEVVRETGFRLGGMPGDMPKLMGVMILNRFSEGPNLASNLAGWSYHFWNGASFGIVLAVLFGHIRWYYGIVLALFIAVGFMAGPATVALGVGRFGVDFGWGFPITVTLAHVAYGALFGYFDKKWLHDESGFFHQIRLLFFSGRPQRLHQK
ncbi:MAG: hypothetical protein GXO76_02235 [Calditrichaeota bacterium]|nr:hypothetical protein [Calditrichota bacterium]